ncbi:MAG: hypothetical protein HY040_25345 [Planctomycetes bacterium]|nr:hypothetical protein [Planctomycetota bacterium]
MIGKHGRTGVAAIVAGCCVATILGCTLIEKSFPPRDPKGPEQITVEELESQGDGGLKTDNRAHYFVIIEWGGGMGRHVYRQPISGREVVLDLIGQIPGLMPSKRGIWLVRPFTDCDEVLTVDWKAITERGVNETNHEILPGDRIYVGAIQLTQLELCLSQLWAPLERILALKFW